MKRKKLIILSCAIVIILITVLIIFLSINSKKSKTEGNGMFTSYYGWFNDKIAFVPDQANQDVMYVHDLVSGQSTALCNQPDCKHQSFEQNPETKCTAVPPKDYKWYHAFYYDDKIYEVFESTNRFVIFSAEKDGANRKEIILSEEFNPSW